MLVLHPLHNKALCEFVGTAALVTIGVGAVMQSGLDGGGGLLTAALAHGLTIAIMVTAAGHISGGHFNPAVTFALWVNRKMDAISAAVYFVAQMLGAIVGAALVKVAFPDDRYDFSAGAPQLADGVSIGQGILLEAIMTFFLMWVVMAVAVDRDGAWFRLAGLPIGFAVAADILMGGQLTGGVMNPARSFGPQLIAGEFGDWWVWWVGSAIGAVVAATLYLKVIRPRFHDAPAA